MAPTTDKEWKGYTLDELRFRRLLSLTKLEVEKNNLAHHVDTIRGGHATESKGWMTKITGALDYIDYAAIAFTLGKKLFRVFRRKR